MPEAGTPTGTPPLHRRRSSASRLPGDVEVSEATFYVWKKKCANLGSTEIRELRQLMTIRLCPAKSCLPTVPRNFSGSGRSRVNDWYVTAPPSNKD